MEGKWTREKSSKKDKIKTKTVKKGKREGKKKEDMKWQNKIKRRRIDASEKERIEPMPRHGIKKGSMSWIKSSLGVKLLDVTLLFQKSTNELTMLRNISLYSTILASYGNHYMYNLFKQLLMSWHLLTDSVIYMKMMLVQFSTRSVPAMFLCRFITYAHEGR